MAGVEVEGITLHVEDVGAGDPPILLLHGFFAGTFSWAPVLPRLAERHRVVAFDRVGFGRTSRPVDASAYTPDAALRHTLAVVEQLGIERPIVIGHSAGAIYATLLAQQVPVTSVVLEAPVLRGGPPPLPGFRRWGPPLLRAGRPLLGRALGTAWHGRPPPATVDAYRASTTEPRWAEALVELTLAPRPADVTVLVATLDVPVLVVAGEHDRFSRGDLGRPVALIAGAGHVPHEERPDDFLAALSPLVEV